MSKLPQLLLQQHKREENDVRIKHTVFMFKKLELVINSLLCCKQATD